MSQKWRKDPKANILFLVDFVQIYSGRNAWHLDFSRENGFRNILE